MLNVKYTFLFIFHMVKQEYPKSTGKGKYTANRIWTLLVGFNTCLKHQTFIQNSYLTEPEVVALITVIEEIASS